MTTVLAQTPDPTAFLQFWLVLGVIINVLVGLGTLIVMSTNRKQKREITFTEEMATKREFDQHCKVTSQHLADIRSEVKQDRHDHQVHGSERSKTLFTQLQGIRTELDAKIDSTRDQLSEKIDAMPERVIAMLKNTGAI